jgi:hypothetical protein
MLISTYDPTAQAGCPECGLVECEMIAGNLAYDPRYLTFYHAECGTKWKRFIDEERTEILSGEGQGDE